MNESNRAEFAARLRAKDADAFDELIRQHHPSLYQLARRVVGDPHDAQEVVQEAFLAAYQAIAGFNGLASPKTWLLSIAYRKALDLLRRRRVRQWWISGDLEESDLWKKVQMVEKFTDWGDNPEHYYRELQLQEFLKKLLEEVPAESKAVFELRDLQGLGSRETAEILQISEGAVRVRLHRVRQYITAELQILFEKTGRIR